MLKTVLKYIFFVVVGAFALIGMLFTGVFIAMRFGAFNVRGSIQERNQFFSFPTATTATTTPVQTCADPTVRACSWSQTPEWAVIKTGLEKDEPIISDVSLKTGVPKRMIAAVVVPEQIRFFTSSREIFKSYFEPLKILGSLTQFSLGVSGIKQETANKIEEYAASTTSPFYPGRGMTELVAYDPGDDHDSTLYARLTDPTSHYYSYLYTALFIKEIEAQWQRQGFDASQNPGIIVTLFNIGYQASHPNANPGVGGAPITTGGTTYVYGELGVDFYNSDELTDIFPK